MWRRVSPPVSLLPITLRQASARHGLRFRPHVTCSMMAFVSTNTYGLHYDHVLVILSGIMRCEGSFVSQCMWRLTMPDGAKGPSAHSFQPASSRIQWSSMRMVTPGDLQCEASSPCPQQDHFEKLLEETCSNHTYPIKHKLKDCDMIKNLDPSPEAWKSTRSLMRVTRCPSPEKTLS
jgi:hypothetical protein